MHKGIIWSFEKYFINKQYFRVHELGDKLTEIDPLIEGEFFRPINPQVQYP